MARTYKRDGSGRFAGGGGGSSGGGKRPAAKSVSRGVNRLTRDNAGKITSVGGEGATARGGRLRTAAGNRRAMQTAKVSGGKTKGTISKKRQVAAAPKPTAAVSSTRQAATDRLKIKTQTRRAMRADRGSVVTPGQRSKLETGKGKTIKIARLSPTIAKPRTVGNTKPQVASRVERKLNATRANLSSLTRYGSIAKQSTYERQLKRSMTLERAQSFIKTGKLPGRDNSIAAQRNTKQARQRLAAKNAERKTQAAKPAATPKPAAKLPREQRLARATATASRIAKKRKQAADETGAAFAERRRISGRASSKARSSAFAKEAVAGKQSASALQSFLRADNRESNLITALGKERQAARTAAPKPAAATTNKPSARKADLSPSAFKRRAEVADVRARFAESNVQGLDRANPKNRRAFNRADNMRNAANSYSSILKRSQSSEFSPAQIFNSRRKYSTNPKQTSSEKAAKTRADNKMKTFEKNVKAQERARRFR